MKNKIFTLTIGIPAYNEEANISFLLQSILKQKQKLFKLEKIIVNCDGCIDKTASLARDFSKKHPLIKIIENRKQCGKATRLNQLFKLNTSDIIINLDGDIILEGKNCLNRLIKPFLTQNIILVSANNQPAPARTFVERISSSSFHLWYEIRKNFKQGNNVHNIHGCAVALRKSFADIFQYPENKSVSDSGFVYMTAKEKKGKFHFARKAIVRFRSTSNLKDITLQSSRNLSSRRFSKNFFGNSALKEYSISKTSKFKGIIIALLKDPVFTPLAIIMNLTLRVLPKEMFNPNMKGVWKTSKSTKTVI